MADSSDLSAGLLGGLAGAAGFGAVGLAGPLGFAIGGIAALLGNKAKKDEQNRQIEAHNKKIKSQRKLVNGKKKEVGQKMAGIGTYFDTLDEYKTNEIDANTSNELDMFLASTVGQIEDFEDVSAKTGLESSSINKKISTIKDLTALKSEDIKNIGRGQKESLAFDIAAQRRNIEQSSRNMWQDLADQYDILGDEYMETV